MFKKHLQPFKGQTVLIIEDEPFFIEIYKTTLESLGFEIITAGTGVSGLAKATEMKPSLVLLDIVLPGRDGFSVLSSLKDNPDTKDIPVIILTALEVEAERRRGLELGAQCYLFKSKSTPKELVEKIHSCLRE